MKPKYRVIERTGARGRDRRVWDTYDPTGMAVLEIVATKDGISVHDGDGSLIGFVPLGDTRATHYIKKV